MQTLSLCVSVSSALMLPVSNTKLYFSLFKIRNITGVMEYVCLLWSKVQTFPLRHSAFAQKGVTVQDKGVPAAHISQLVEHLTEKSRAILMQV